MFRPWQAPFGFSPQKKHAPTTLSVLAKHVSDFGFDVGERVCLTGSAREQRHHRPTRLLKVCKTREALDKRQPSAVSQPEHSFVVADPSESDRGGAKLLGKLVPAATGRHPEVVRRKLPATQGTTQALLRDVGGESGGVPRLDTPPMQGEVVK